MIGSPIDTIIAWQSHKNEWKMFYLSHKFASYNFLWSQDYMHQIDNNKLINSLMIQTKPSHLMVTLSQFIPHTWPISNGKLIETRRNWLSIFFLFLLSQWQWHDYFWNIFAEIIGKKFDGKKKRKEWKKSIQRMWNGTKKISIWSYNTEIIADIEPNRILSGRFVSFSFRIMHDTHKLLLLNVMLC